MLKSLLISKRVELFISSRAIHNNYSVTLFNSYCMLHNTYMILLIGFEKEDIDRIKDSLKDSEVFTLSQDSRNVVLKDIIENVGGYLGDCNWSDTKFVLMHDIDNEGIKRTLSVFKNLEMRDAIFATTTPTSLTWKLNDLLNELIEEHEYFKKQKDRDS